MILQGGTTVRGGTTVAGALTRGRLRRAAAGGRRIAASVAPALVAIALLAGAPPARASEASEILEKCARGEPLSGFSQKGYREALKHMSTEVSEYSPCSSLISKAELATASGVSPEVASSDSSSTPIPLTPAERGAVANAHSDGSTPVQVEGRPIRPGVVHADIASALNTLPDSLIAVLALMLAGALALALGEVRKRVRARRHG